MKKLYISLLLSAFISLFALGWLIDTFSQIEVSQVDEFIVEKQLIDGFAEQIALSEDKQAATVLLAQHFSQNLTYNQNSDLALHQSLLDDLTIPGGLMLEDEIGFYLLKSHSNFADFHLELRLTKPDAKTHRLDLLLTLSFYLGVCLLMWLWLSPLTKRLSLLYKTSQQFASGDLSARIKLSKFTYITDVEVAFNRMAAQIQKLMEENKLLASSLSHDIRTPVACLRFGLDAALDCSDVDKKDQYLLRMETDLDHMECMLKTYLEFASLEKNSYQINFHDIDLSEYFINLGQQISPQLQSKNIQLTIDCKAIAIQADLHWLGRAIVNLLSNGCDFAQNQLRLSAKQTDRFTFIYIEDDGPGIAKDNWQHVFEPFFKEQNHRNRSDKSYGLGLAIAAKVIDWHFGSISVDQSDSLHGARFTIALPLKCPRTSV